MPKSIAYEGGCVCGSVRYKTSGEPLWACHCHCRICQRHTGSAFATFVGFLSESVTWIKGKPSLYQFSDGCQRGFCTNCGSTLSFHRAPELSISVGSMDHPESVTPEFHIMTEKQIPWLKIDDGLPRHRRFSPEGEDRDTGL
jgi:hypothetical protein